MEKCFALIEKLLVQKYSLEIKKIPGACTQTVKGVHSTHIIILELLKIDEPDILTTAPVNEKNKIVASIKDSVFKTHRENCMARLKDNSEGKLRTFQKFKTEYCMETYLLDLPNLSYTFLLYPFIYYC